MSRKTRKLIWSVPLVAVLAVAGVLAIFAALAPNGAQAQEVMVPGPVTDLDAEVQSRSEIRLTWDAPSSTRGGTPTGYRIDHSSDNREWTLLKGNTNSTATRYSIVTGVKATTEKYYRVFAINQAGTGPVSVDPVTAYASVPTEFPPTAPGRPGLTLTLDAKDPYGKIHISWTKPDDNGSAIVSYKIVEMINADGVGTTAREECDDTYTGDVNTPNPHPNLKAAEDANEDDDWCLLIDEHTDFDDLTAMHAGLTGGQSHYYRVIATNSADDPAGAPSDTRGITTRTPRNPDEPTEPIAVPLTGDIINLYWLDSESNGGHALGDYQIQVQARVREQVPDTSDFTENEWGAWSEWTSLNNPATGVYLTDVSFTAKNGTVTDSTIAMDIEEGDAADTTSTPGTDGVITAVGEAFNLRLTGAAEAGQYKFQIKAKQSGAATRGLDLESAWVGFNKRSRAGLGYITVQVAPPVSTQIPLLPSLEAKNLDAEEVKDQGIGLTWDPNPGVPVDHDNDANTPDVNRPAFDNPDYRIDVSEDGIVWKRGQTRTIAVREWDHEGLKSSDRRYYRLFPINHGRFGEAAIAGAQAKKAVIASPDKVLNLRQKSATTTSITMEWDAVTAAAEYALYSATPGDDDALPASWPPDPVMTLEGTEYTDSKDLDPGDTRWYRVIALSDDEKPVSGADGAEALGRTEDAGEPGAPIGLVAQEAFDSSLTSSDDRGVLLLWDMPTEAGKDPHTSYTVEWKSSAQTGDAWETLVTDTTNLENQTPKSTHYHHKEPELEANEQRAYRVKALSGSGSGMASNVSYYPPMAGMAMPGMLGNAMGLTAGPTDDNDPGSIKLTWTAGENANVHWVVVVLVDANGDFDVDNSVWTQASAQDSHTVAMETEGLIPGNYRAMVIAGMHDSDAGTTQWSTWQSTQFTYPQ